jgi:hypothetical protein
VWQAVADDLVGAAPRALAGHGDAAAADLAGAAPHALAGHGDAAAADPASATRPALAGYGVAAPVGAAAPEARARGLLSSDAQPPLPGTIRYAS